MEIEVVSLPSKRLYKPHKPHKPRILVRKPRKVKKPVKRKIKPTSTKKADIAFSKFIRTRDGRCVRCGKTAYLQNSHFWPRAISSVRYDPENCDALCYGCHYGDRINGWEYAKQGAYRDFKLSQLGEKRYQELALRATISVKRQIAIKQWEDLLLETQATDRSNAFASIAEQQY